MKRRSMAWIVASGAVLMALGTGVPQAEAQSHAPAVRFARTNASSNSEAGYLLQNLPASASAKDKFKVPTLTCPSTGSYGIALGAFLDTSSGTTGAEVTALCSGGTAVYNAFYLANGLATGASFTPAAGDLIQAQGSETATTTNAAITDLTQHLSSQTSSNVGATNFDILLGMRAAFTIVQPVPPFGSSRFTAGRIDGRTVLASGAVAYNMRTSGVLQIRTGALSSTGTAWSEVFKHS